tara:strand:- start:43 stop:324 length:282 start_codon:yes stop_codon:yes gene_type:complete
MKAIYALYPNAVTIREEEDGSIEVTDNNGNKIEIDMTQVNAWVNPNLYQQKRAAEYKPLAEQLDMQYHDVQDGTETWLDHIKEVKAKYPKGDK